MAKANIPNLHQKDGFCRKTPPTQTNKEQRLRTVLGRFEISPLELTLLVAKPSSSAAKETNLIEKQNSGPKLLNRRFWHSVPFAEVSTQNNTLEHPKVGPKFKDLGSF